MNWFQIVLFVIVWSFVCRVIAESEGPLVAVLVFFGSVIIGLLWELMRRRKGE